MMKRALNLDFHNYFLNQFTYVFQTIILIVLLFNTSNLLASSPISTPRDSSTTPRAARSPFELQIAFHNQYKEESVSTKDQHVHPRGNSSAIKLNYYVIDGTEPLRSFIEQTYEHDIATNPNARYEEYPFMFSVMTKRGLKTHHLASLMIPRPEALEHNPSLQMTLLISSLIDEEHVIRFSKKDTSSPREFTKHTLSKKVYPQFLKALLRNCKLELTSQQAADLERPAKKLYTQSAHIINELKSLWQIKAKGLPITNINPTLTGYFIMYHTTLKEIIDTYTPKEKTAALQKEISDLTGWKIPTPRVTKEIQAPLKKKTVKKKIVRKKKRTPTTSQLAATSLPSAAELSNKLEQKPEGVEVSSPQNINIKPGVNQQNTVKKKKKKRVIVKKDLQATVEIPTLNIIKYE